LDDLFGILDSDYGLEVFLMNSVTHLGGFVGEPF